MRHDKQFEALGDATRRGIFEQLQMGPRSVREFADEFPVSRPAVSQHLKVLKNAGLVRDVAVGTRRIYSIDPAGLEPLRGWVETMWNQALSNFGGSSRQDERNFPMTIEPVSKQIKVPVSPEQAFEIFTGQIGS